MFQTSGWRSETLKQQPSDSCSPCARHFLTATNLGLLPIFYTLWYKNATEILAPAAKNVQDSEKASRARPESLKKIYKVGIPVILRAKESVS
jgi:hypothetical protein